MTAQYVVPCALALLSGCVSDRGLTASTGDEGTESGMEVDTGADTGTEGTTDAPPTGADEGEPPPEISPFAGNCGEIDDRVFEQSVRTVATIPHVDASEFQGWPTLTALDGGRALVVTGVNSVVEAWLIDPDDPSAFSVVTLPIPSVDEVDFLADGRVLVRYSQLESYYFLFDPDSPDDTETVMVNLEGTGFGSTDVLLPRADGSVLVVGSWSDFMDDGADTSVANYAPESHTWSPYPGHVVDHTFLRDVTCANPCETRVAFRNVTKWEGDGGDTAPGYWYYDPEAGEFTAVSDASNVWNWLPLNESYLIEVSSSSLDFVGVESEAVEDSLPLPSGGQYTKALSLTANQVLTTAENGDLALYDARSHELNSTGLAWTEEPGAVLRLSDGRALHIGRELGAVEVFE